jgi:tetrahydromethanopterin S-methyltransferase subunit D
MDVVEIVNVDVAPVEVGVMVAGEKPKVPQGDTPETGVQTVGVGEGTTPSVTGEPTPWVSVAVIVAVNVEPALIVVADVGVAVRV